MQTIGDPWCRDGGGIAPIEVKKGSSASCVIDICNYSVICSFSTEKSKSLINSSPPTVV